MALSAMRLQRLGHARLDLDRQSRLSRSNRARDVVVAAARVRHRTGDELVEDDAKRVDIRARVDRLVRIELLRREVVQRSAEVSGPGIARRQTEVQDLRRQRPSSMMLDGFRSRCWMPRSCARWMATQTSRRIAARCRNSSDGASRPSSNPSTNSMMMTGGVASARNSNTCTMLGSENSASDLASRRNSARLVRIGGISAQDLRRDDPIELQILQLVHLAHAAGAETFDRAEAFEGRQRRRLGRCGRALATRVSCGVEGRRESEVAIRQ